MKIAVIGAAGKAGSLIAAEALNRGHAVTAIVKPGSEGRVAPGLAILPKSLFDLTPEDLKGFNAVVSAFGTPFTPGNGKLHVEAAKHLIEVFKSLPDVRLIVIGGAGSLYTDESKTATILDGIPAAFAEVPAAAKDALELFRAADINWSFFSPAATFDRTGERTGKYELGGDVRILNRMGQSYISYADAAVALVDEAESGKNNKKRFTAISCDPYFRKAPQFFDVSRYQFSRGGSFMALSIDDTRYGRGALYLTSARSMRGHRRESPQVFRIYPTHEGKKVPFAVQQMDASELAVHTRYGDVRFTFGDRTKLLAEGDPGMGLMWTHAAAGFELVKPRKGGAWEAGLRGNGPYVFKGLEGSDFRFDDTWNWNKMNCGDICGRTYPGPDGRFTLVCEENEYASKPRASYPTYAEAKASMQADWEDFLSKYPKLIAPYDKKREETAYVLWRHLVGPTALAPHWMMCMFPTEMCSQWQQVQNGVALQDNPEISRNLLLAPLERQGEDGQLADTYDEAYITTNGIKPPVYGWALKNIMARHDIGKEWPREDLEKLYTGVTKWANWFMECRDDDEDGLPCCDCGTDNGFDDVTTFQDHLCLATPDLCAFEVLCFEALGDLAKLLGKPAAEAEDWYRRSKELLARMIEKMWDGEHFVALTQFTHEPVFAGSNLHYIPLVLGERLPAEIVDKMCADLMVEGKLLSPYGLASENMDSDAYEVTGVKMGTGVISPPGQVFILTGLWAAGKKKEAKMIIDRYLNTLMETRFPHFIDPIAGDGRFWGTWCRAVFTILARMVSEG